MTIDYVRERITTLRIEKNISERQMSLDLGHSPSYINGISSGKKSPSLSELFYICEYLGIHVSEFFNEVREISLLKQEIYRELCLVEDTDLNVITDMLSYLPRARKK